MEKLGIEVARDELVLAAGDLGRVFEFGQLTPKEVRDHVGASTPVSPELEALWSLATPLRVSVPFAPDSLSLFPPGEIADRNVGYLGETWRSEWLVVGDVAGDPVIADVGSTGTPVMLAVHGMGAWHPAIVAPTPTAFLSGVAAWLRVLSRFGGERLDEDDDFNVKPGFDEALKYELRLVMTNDCVDALIAYIDT